MKTIPMIALGVLLAAAIWAWQRRSFAPTLRFALVLLLTLSGVVLIVVFVVPGGGVFLGGKAWYDESPWRELLFLALMLLGMAARYFASAIEERRDRIKALAAKGDTDPRVPLRFDAWEFSYPLLFSVVTFGGLLGQIKDDGVQLTNLVLSFQTGFFWQTILKKQVGDSKPA